MLGLKADGYTVSVPETAEALRKEIIEGNAQQYGAEANVHTVISADDHVRRDPWLKEIEAQWGPAPGKQWSNGSGIFILGKQYGNVLVTVQPGFGFEGDPMRRAYQSAVQRLQQNLHGYNDKTLKMHA